MVRNILILLIGSIVAAWLVWRPVPLKSAETSLPLPTFAQVQDDLGGAAQSYTTTRISGSGPRQPANCYFPPLPQGATLVLLSALRGQAVSTAALASQDKTVTSASLTIAPGDAPLYIVMVTGNPIIWRVTGAVERVHRLVLVRSSDEAGATGLPRQRVAFVAKNCVQSFGAAGTAEAALSGGQLNNALGRMPDVAAAGERVSDFAIPSGEVSTTDPRTFWYRLRNDPKTLREYLGFGITDLMKPNLTREFRNHFPDGVAQIDPAHVVADITARSFEVLPGVAGLHQLVQDGAIEDRGWDTYYVKKPIRLPGDLDRAMAEFVVLKGVRPPTGTKGVVCVVSQDTGALLPISKQRPHC